MTKARKNIRFPGTASSTHKSPTTARHLLTRGTITLQTLRMRRPQGRDLRETVRALWSQQTITIKTLPIRSSHFLAMTLTVTIQNSVAWLMKTWYLLTLTSQWPSTSWATNRALFGLAPSHQCVSSRRLKKSRKIPRFQTQMLFRRRFASPPKKEARLVARL